MSKHPRVGSIPSFGNCPLADQVFDSIYRGAPQLKVAPGRVKLLRAGRSQRLPIVMHGDYARIVEAAASW